ncbi:unnamed protein product, partial [Protopolystoma xenopodis]
NSPYTKKPDIGGGGSGGGGGGGGGGSRNRYVGDCTGLARSQSHVKECLPTCNNLETSQSASSASGHRLTSSLGHLIATREMRPHVWPRLNGRTSFTCKPAAGVAPLARLTTSPNGLGLGEVAEMTPATVTSASEPESNRGESKPAVDSQNSVGGRSGTLVSDDSMPSEEVGVGRSSGSVAESCSPQSENTSSLQVG